MAFIVLVSRVVKLVVVFSVSPILRVTLCSQMQCSVLYHNLTINDFHSIMMMAQSESTLYLGYYYASLVVAVLISKINAEH